MACVWIVAACLPVTVQAACDRARPEADRVRDTATGLTWRRCASGSVPRDGRCLGAPLLMGHAQARRHAIDTGEGWRLPTLAELQGIVERRCRNPAVNAQVFPDVTELYEGGAKYWSSTSAKELPGLFYNVDFMDGTIDANSAGIAMGVRLVRASASRPSRPQPKRAGARPSTG